MPPANPKTLGIGTICGGTIRQPGVGVPRARLDSYRFFVTKLILDVGWVHGRFPANFLPSSGLVRASSGQVLGHEYRDQSEDQRTDDRGTQHPRIKATLRSEHLPYGDNSGQATGDWKDESWSQEPSAEDKDKASEGLKGRIANGDREGA